MSVHIFNLDEVEVRGVPVPDLLGRIRSGFYLAKDGLTGLRGGVSMLANDVQRTSGDGVFPTPARYGARVTNWKVHTVARSREERAELDSMLTGIGGARRRFLVTAQMDGLNLDTLARCGEVPDPLPEQRPRRGRWVSTSEFSLVHDDPILYGTSTTERGGASITLEQRIGAIDAWPELEVIGTGQGYVVTGGGATFSVTTPLPSGQVDRIDAATRSIIRNGSPLFSGFSGWVAPVPRRGTTTYTVSRGNLTGTVRPTYL